MNLLNGKKTYIGLALVAGYYVGRSHGIPMPDSMLEMGYTMAAVGVAHKLEKIAGAVKEVKK